MGSDTYQERRVTYPFTFGERVVVFENVPALVCSQCSELLLDPRTADIIHKLGRGEQPPSRTAEVPVYDLAEIA